MTNKLTLPVESRMQGDLHVRFGGRLWETYHRKVVRRPSPSLRWYSPYEDTIENLHGARLAAYLHNNFGSHLFVPKIYYKGRRRRRSRLFCTTECPLTGYYMDNMILDPIYCFFTHPDDTTFYDLIECCLDTFFRACRDDARYCRSEEYFAELAESNAWEYLASGTAYHLIN